MGVENKPRAIMNINCSQSYSFDKLFKDKYLLFSILCFCGVLV